MHFNRNYFIAFCLLLIIEICIALFVHDTIIRPFIGDVLVVILIYCFVKTFTDTSYPKVILGVLLFAYTVEVLQATSMIHWLGLENNRIAKIILGTTFDWKDLLAYTVGALLILIFEKYYLRSKFT